MPHTAVDALEDAVWGYLEDAGWTVEEASEFFAMEAYLTDESELDDFPDLSLDIDGYTRSLSPSDYLFEYDSVYYWGVGESTLPIVGDVALDGLVVVFDLENDQVGFGDATCDDDDSSSSAVPAKLQLLAAAAPAASADARARWGGAAAALVAVVGAVT